MEYEEIYRKWKKGLKNTEEEYKSIDETVDNSIYDLYFNDNLDNLTFRKLVFVLRKMGIEYYYHYVSIDLFDHMKSLIFKLDNLFYPKETEYVYITFFGKTYHKSFHYWSYYDKFKLSKRFAERLNYRECKVCKLWRDMEIEK